MAEEETVIDNFVIVTGTSKERATFFLQAAGWNLQAALDAFYDSRQQAQQKKPGETLHVDEDADADKGGELASDSGSRRGFATLSDYQQQQQATADDDSEKFFAGGSEHSGQLIAGPPRKKPTPDAMAKEVFEAAKKQGAVNVDEEERKQQQEKSAAFRGTGFRLGDSDGPSQAVTGRPVSKQPEKVRHVLTFWANGFSVDDGPLRNGESEEDRRFLASVSKGEIPHELVQAAHGEEVDINIEDRRNDPFVQRAPKLVAFSGEGRKLGSLVPAVMSHPQEQRAEAAPTDTAPTVPLDPTQPTTSVQIRLADGTRLVTKFNYSHTINDVRQFINLSRPSMSDASYILMTTFPNRELTDLTLTLAEAKLLNAVIVQRMK